MLMEIAGDDLHFQALTRPGVTIDSGTLRRPGADGKPSRSATSEGF
jgi:hypothetical protein